MGNAAKLGIAAVGIVAAVVLFFIVRQDDGGGPSAPPPAAPTEAPTGDTETAAETGGATTEPPPPPPPAAPEVVRARITIGPDGPTRVQRIEARRGQRVVITIVSQLSDHAHLHGYDLFVDVGGGRPARMTFEANIPGRFEMELEDRHEPIADLRVS